MARRIKQETNNVQQETVTYEYTSHTSCHFNYKDKEFSLHKNHTYTLPDCPFVRSLIAQGRLVKK